MSGLERVGRLSPQEVGRFFLFESLTEEQLRHLADVGWVGSAPADAVVFREGEPADLLVLLLDGTIALSRRVGRDDVETARTDQIGVYAGAVLSYVRDDDPQARTYNATLRACSDVRLFVLPAAEFDRSVREWFPMAVHLLEGLYFGMRRTQRLVGQRERLLALGTLSAGLMHELNNPAAAAMRATAGLRERVAGMRHKLAMLAHDELDPRVLSLLVDVQEDAVSAVAEAPKLSPLEESEREDELGEWLEDHEVAGAWELAPIFVGAGTTTDFLDKVAAAAGRGDTLQGAVRWLAYTLESELLMDEITDSVTRVSKLVASARQYSNLDRSPYERADIHAGLKSTLVMLGGKLADIEVVKDFDRSLPPVPMYPAELNQVWTNLIDNAVQAMDGHGTLRLRTALDGEHLRVEIGDTGPGIPEELRQRIFEPFFTTKPVGHGTGLGLDISHRIVVDRHGGDLAVESRPGDTRFIVRLPLRERPHEPADGV